MFFLLQITCHIHHIATITKWSKCLIARWNGKSSKVRAFETTKRYQTFPHPTLTKEKIRHAPTSVCHKQFIWGLPFQIQNAWKMKQNSPYYHPLDIKCYFYRYLSEKKSYKHVLAPDQECKIILVTLDVIYNISNQDIKAPLLNS